MKKVLLFIFILFSASVYAQIQNECRVYYLDCSYSMVTNGIWDKVRDNLKNAIDNVTDETTDLYVIPFTDYRKTHFPLPVYLQKATSEGKRFLKEKIDGLSCDRHCNTIHHVPLENFYKQHLNENKITYMFLMTDGKNEKMIDEFNQKLNSWDRTVYNKNAYGFFVMLYKEANDNRVLNIINKQKYFWKVETADVNINVVYLDKKALFNVRNDKYVEIPFTGNLSLKDIQVKMRDNPYYSLGNIDIVGNKLRLEVEKKMTISELPIKGVIQLQISDVVDDFTFIVTDAVVVNCLNKKEYALKLNIR